MKNHDVAVICVLKSGGDFIPEDVFRLKQMLEKNITIPYKFYCLTNVLSIINEPYGLTLNYDYKGWWSKVELFREGLVKESRIVYFDLDTLILKNIDDFLLQDINFIGLKPFNRIRSGKQGYFASGIMSWVNDGSLNFVFDAFDYVKYSRKFRGDQDWLSYIFRGMNMQTAYWQDTVAGIYSYKRELTGKRYLNGHVIRVVCFHGNPRPHQVNVAWVRKALLCEY